MGVSDRSDRKNNLPFQFSRPEVMKFLIEYGHKPEQRCLSYVSGDYAFTMDPFVQEIDFNIAINFINLTVIDNKVVQVDGFCPEGSWIKSNYEVPSYQPGILKVIHNVEFGFSYKLNDKDWSIYVNMKTGWVCIGDPKITGQAVEFIRNCVAVVRDGELLALWLRPENC